MWNLLSNLKSKLLGKKKPPQVERRRGARHRHPNMPQVGQYIIYRHLKMVVTETKSDELWRWLIKHGWQLASFPNDRRCYTVLPENTYAKLDFAATTERPMIIRSYLRQRRDQ